MENFDEAVKSCYLFGDDLVKEVNKLHLYGHIQSTQGDFLFNYCKQCSGPLLGHIATEAACQQTWSREALWQIEDSLIRHGLIEINGALTWSV